MAIGSVSPTVSGSSLSVLSATGSQPTVAEKKAQERSEIDQIEFLAGQLAALKTALETVRDEWRSTANMSAPRARDLAGALRDAFTAVNAIFAYDVPGGGEPAGFLANARRDLLAGLEEGVKSDNDGLAGDLYLVLDFDEDEEITGDLLPAGRRLEKLLSRAIRKRTSAAGHLLFGGDPDSGEGLIGQLALRRSALFRSLGMTAGYRGLSLDSYA